MPKRSLIANGVIIATIYYLTTSRFLPWGDGVEFYLAGRNLGIPHPTGYPLFVIISRIFLIISSSPFSLNLLSSLTSVIASIILGLIIYHFTRDETISLVSTLTFAFGKIVWLQSITAEIYTLNLFILLLILLVTLKIEKRYSVPIIFYLGGLALTNHLTSIFYIIPIIVYSLLRRKPGYYPILFFIPLTLYLFFPIRSRANPQPDTFNPEDLKNLMVLVSGEVFHYRTFFTEGSYPIKSLLSLFHASWQQCLILLPVGIYGIIKFKDQSIRRLILIIISASGLYTLLYNIPDKEGYYIPIFALYIIFIAIGLFHLIPIRYRMTLLFLPIAFLLINFRWCNYSSESSLSDLTDIIYRDLPDRSMIFSDDFFVYYALMIRETEVRRGVIPINDFYLRFPWYVEELRKSVIIPERVEVLIKGCEERLTRVGKVEYGEISKRYCHLIKREIVLANIDQIPVYTYIYNDGEWPDQWLDLYLEYHGLYYRLVKERPGLKTFPLSIPPPEKYRIDRMISDDGRTVTKKFASAYNRRGIYHFRQMNLDNAISDFQTALAYYPTYYQVYPNIALANLSRGDTTEALRWLEKYLRSGFTDRKTPLVRRIYQNIIRDYHADH